MCGVTTDDEVLLLLTRLHSWHVGNPPLRSIAYVDTVVPETPGHRRHPPVYVLGECDTENVDGVARIALFRQQPQGNNDVYDFRFSLYHEIGHAVFWILTSHQKKAWYSLCSDNVVFWNRAGTDPLEHFCDTYAHFVADELVVEKGFPREHEYMKGQVFSWEAVRCLS